MAAIKALKTLIRLHKRELDELRRKLAALESQKTQLLHLSRRLDEELNNEQERAATMPEMAAFMGRFAQRIRERKEQIAAEVKNLEAQMETLSAAIGVKFSEMKKYEIARDNRLAQERAEAEKKEMQALDEVAIGQFIRKAVTSDE